MFNTDLMSYIIFIIWNMILYVLRTLILQLLLLVCNELFFFFLNRWPRLLVMSSHQNKITCLHFLIKEFVTLLSWHFYCDVYEAIIKFVMIFFFHSIINQLPEFQQRPLFSLVNLICCGNSFCGREKSWFLVAQRKIFICAIFLY